MINFISKNKQFQLLTVIYIGILIFSGFILLLNFSTPSYTTTITSNKVKSDVFPFYNKNKGSSFPYTNLELNLQSFSIAGAEDDVGVALTTDSMGNILVTGYTSSTNFQTLNAFDSTLNGQFDVFVIKVWSSRQFNMVNISWWFKK